MRIIILVITLVFAFLSAQAQELNFLGISLEQPQESIHTQLLEKGMVDRPSKYEGYYMRGDFWKFKDCDVTVYGTEGAIVGVKPPSWITVDTINDLIQSLTKKYGAPDTSQSSDFHQEFTWYIGDNCIVITDFYIDGHNYNIAYMSKAATQNKIAKTKNYDADL